MDEKVEIEPDYIRISDRGGIVAEWSKEEWLEDPSLTPIIADAIMTVARMGTTGLRDKIGKPFDPVTPTVRCKLCRDVVDREYQKRHLEVVHNFTPSEPDRVLDMYESVDEETP